MCLTCSRTLCIAGEVLSITTFPFCKISIVLVRFPEPPLTFLVIPSATTTVPIAAVVCITAWLAM